MGIAEFAERNIILDKNGVDAMGEVQATPTEYTLLRRLKDLLTGTILATPTHTAPSIGATTTAALASNANRLYALFINDSNEVIYLKLGAAAVLNQGIRLNASGGSYEMSKLLGNLYTGAINAICATGGKKLLILEGV